MNPKDTQGVRDSEKGMTEVTMTLPDSLVQEARAAGLLTSYALEAILREAMKKRQLDQLFIDMNRLAALEPALTEEEIDAEIAAARAERARRR